jgi:cytosine/adenosine deaminase-related metal-dependent hydrolase
MEGRLVLKNCSLFRPDGRGRTGMALVVEEGFIRRIAPDGDVPVLPGDWEVSCRGRLVAPGLVDCHAHLVGGLLLPPSGEYFLRSAHARQEQERRLAEHLTAADVEVLSLLAMARALREGVTQVVEHLSCPREVAQALEAQARAAERLGLRLVTSHATHSLEGEATAQAQAEANADFARRRGAHPLVRGALGFHASWTSGDALLERLGRLREQTGVPVLFHLAEGEHDLAATWAQHSRRVVTRLEAFGLLGPGAVATHARAVDDAEATRLEQSGTFIALDPSAALATEPRDRSLATLLARQNLLGLGSGGHGNLWDALSAAVALVVSAARGARLVDPDGVLAQVLVDGPAELGLRLFGARSGLVEEGRLADLVVYDLVPAVESDSGLAPYLLTQMRRARVAWNIVAGRVTVREGQLLGVDEVELARAAARVLSDVWARARVPEAGLPPVPGG